MLEGVFSLHRSDTLQQAIQLLAEEQIHSLADLDDADKPIGMISDTIIIDALAQDTSYDTPLSSLPLDPVVLSSATTSLKAAIQTMKHAHEYKALVVDEQGKVSHVVPSEEILARLAIDFTPKIETPLPGVTRQYKENSNDTESRTRT